MTTMTKDRIRTVDIPILDKVFQMESGWVLNFVNRTFAEFFREELDVNIDDPKYAKEGSKAKRLRFFLRNCERATALKTLLALWEYRETSKVIADYEELPDDIRDAFLAIIERLGGKAPASDPPSKKSKAEPAPTLIDPSIAKDLATKLTKVSGLDPHPRGYAFESFLKEFFDAYGLSARSSFRLVGEQIDGSFELSGDTYLIEAKWANSLTDAATLRAFNAKVEDKAAWSRGLFVSHSGFSEDGLTAFGRGNSVICMDGLDLYQIVDQRLDFAAVLAMKVRRAAETGQPFIRVRELNLPSSSC